MTAMVAPVPSMQPEDYRALLKGVCILNWGALGLALLLEVLILYSLPDLWPRWGDFGQVYNLILLEFGVITAGLTILLRRTHWLDRAPRAALGRLRWLLLAVLVLDGLHFAAFFHVTGGLHGPVATYLPLGLLVIYLSLPCAEAHIVNASWLAMLVLLGMGKLLGLIAPSGVLEPVFSQVSALPFMLISLTGVLAALGVGVIASRRMDAAGIGLHRGASYDPLTRLFSREVLEGRLPGELARIGRTESSATLLLVEFKNLPELIPHADYAGFSDVLVRFAATLLGVTRDQGDTCAQYDHSTFAVLLPTATAESAELIAQRIQRGADAIRAPGDEDLSVQLAIGAAVTEQVKATDSSVFLLAAKEALREARESGTGHQMVLRRV